MKDTLSLAAIGTEVLTPDVAGFANFAAYLNLSNMQAGDEVRIIQYFDVEGQETPIIISSVDVSYDDLQLVGEDGSVNIPFSLELSQIGRIGVTLIAGTTPLDVGWRITNLASGL